MAGRSRSTSAGLGAGLLGLLLASGGCGGEPTPEANGPRLVLLYATCTLNRDYLGPYGPSAPGERIAYTPNLDRFAAEGVVFRRHQSESGQSGISFASIFSGTQADVHGIYTHPNRLSEELLLITEAFAEAGYEPWFWSGHDMASYELGYGQGVAPERAFEAKGPGKRKKKLSFLQPDDPQFAAVLERLAADPEYRAFLLVNFTVTHGAYHRQVPRGQVAQFLQAYPGAAEGLTMADLQAAWDLYDGEPESERWNLQWDFPATVERLGLDAAAVERLARALEVTYRADVATLDAMFGRTLATLADRGLMDDSLIAFTADHGEVLRRETALFQWTHGLQLAPEVLSVPWIVRGPVVGIEPGHHDEVSASIDVFPTLAGLCGIDVEGRGPQGRDLSAVLRGECRAEPARAFSHTTTISTETIADFRRWGLASRYFGGMEVERIWVGVRDGDLFVKLRNLDGKRWGLQAFDLAADPAEERDLFDPADPLHAELAVELERYKARLVAGFAGASTDTPENALELLEGLGYVEGR